MRFRRAAALIGLLGLLAPTGANAHEELSLHALTVLGRVSPQVRGLEVRVVHLGAPAIAVRNRTGRTVTVLDGRGRPFLRIASDGVHLNVESAIAYRSVDPATHSVPPGLSDRSRWVRVSKDRAWSWFDPRLVYREGATHWQIPLHVDESSVLASGRFEPLDAHGHFQTNIEVPEVNGLEARVAEGPVPAVFIRNDTGSVLHVDGPAGEAFLRIGPTGVFANTRSPSYYTSALQTIRTVPEHADPAALPRWRRVSGAPVWAWLERRAATPVSLYQRDLLGDERTVVHRWVTPMRLGHESLDIDGAVEWIPPHVSSIASSHTSERSYLAPLAVFSAAMGVFAWRNRRKEDA